MSSKPAAAVALAAAIAVYSLTRLNKRNLPTRSLSEEDDKRNENSPQKVRDLVAALVESCTRLAGAKEGDLNEKDQSSKRATLDQKEDLFENGLVVRPIGVVRSIYRLCVGTPRQGLLAPHARGKIELFTESDAVLGLEDYSHIWIVFVFHLNTIVSGRNGRCNKVAPPALGGKKKVGVLATRTPHRPNPIGMTLCKLDSVRMPDKFRKETILEISGLDLVDGTPVLDVKPWVPHYDSAESVKLPPWVSDGLATQRKVIVSPKAKEELESILLQDPDCLEFYGLKQGDESVQATLEQVTRCIEEVLSIDVRSSWQTKKVRKGKFRAERAGRVQQVMSDNSVAPSEEELLSTQQLDNLFLHYSVSQPNETERDTSEGSGAEDVVTVLSIQLLVAGNGSKCFAKDGTIKAIPRPPLTEEEWFDTNDKSAETMQEGFMDDGHISGACLEGKATGGDTDIGLTETSSFDTPTKSRKEIVLSTSTVDASSAEKVPAPPSDAEYKTLKSYWSKAASQNTPTGLAPDSPHSYR